MQRVVFDLDVAGVGATLDHMDTEHTPQTARIYHGSDPNLTRFPDHHRQLAARLKRVTGRTHSIRA